MVEERPPRRAQSSTSRDLRPRVATSAPSTGAVVEVVEDETTGPVPVTFDEVPDWAARQHKARHRDRVRLDAVGDRIIEHGRRLDELAAANADRQAAASGAALAKQVRRLLVAVALLVPGAGLGAGRAFLDARDAAAATAQRSASEAAALRHDIDVLRSEVAALTRLIWSNPK